MKEKRKALGADLVIPLLALGFTAYFFTSIEGLQWEAKANGVIIGALLVVLIAIQLVRTGVDFTRGRGGFSFAPLVTPRDALRKRIGMMAVTIAFVATLPWLGLALGLFLALAAGFTLMGVRGAKRVLVVSFAVAAVFSLLFTVALDTGLPRGPVENLLFRLIG